MASTVHECHVIDAIDQHRPDEDHLPVYFYQRYANVVRSMGTHPPLCKQKMAGPYHQEIFTRDIANLKPSTW